MDEAQCVFSGIDACIGGELVNAIMGRRYVIGVDLGRKHDATVLTCMDILERKVVDYQRLTQNHWSLQKQSIAAMAYRFNNALCIVEENSFGSPIIEDLRNLGVAVEGFTTTRQSKMSLIDGLRIAIAQRMINFPNIPQLLKELRDFEIDVSKGGVITYHAPEGEGYYDDSVMSLALAVSGLKGELYVARHDPIIQRRYEDFASLIPANQGLTFGR